MRLAASRLNLSLVAEEDLEQVHELHSLPETDEFNTLGLPADLAETRRVLDSWLQAQAQLPSAAYVFRISSAATGEFIGLIGLKVGPANYKTAEVWYKLHVAHWGKGYATEALRCLLDFAFHELELHRVEAGCAVENIASATVLEKAGMTREGRKRKKLPIRGNWYDNYFYAILDEDFAQLG